MKQYLLGFPCQSRGGGQEDSEKKKIIIFLSTYHTPMLKIYRKRLLQNEEAAGG